MEYFDKQKELAAEKEKQAIEWENKVLSILLPAVGLVAFIIGFVGAILVLPSNVGVGVFLIILALLGALGIAYGVIVFLRRRPYKFRKKEHEPSLEPDNQQK